MENNQTEKSQAELYREERKKRMASAAKKKSKTSPQAAKAKKLAGKIIGIVLAVVLVLGAIYGTLNFFGVPQKVLTAAKVGGEKVSVAKYNFYYMDIYQNLYNTAQQYDTTYGEGYGAMYTGYDASKSPMEQAYTLGTIEGVESENPTWADYIRVNTLNYLQSYIAYSKLAREAGMTLTEEELASIEEQIESVRSTASSNDFSLNRWLIQLYGKGVDEKLMREIMEERQLASNYAQQKQQEITDAITDEKIEAEYNENITEYALLSVSAFTVTADTSAIASDATDDEKAAATTEAMAKAKTQADEYAAKVTDAASLLAQAKAYNSSATDESVLQTDVTAASIASAFGQPAGEWVMAAERAVGDVTVVESTNGYTILYMTELPHKDINKPVDVRHILINFPTESDGTPSEISDSEKAAYHEKAEAIYKQYLENPTEENFATLANSNSEDTGSNTNGGLYEDVAVGTMVTEFNDWCFDANRKPGDSGIVETRFGYHIMYFVGNDNEETWKTTVQTALANKEFSTFDESIINGDEYKIDNSQYLVKWSATQLEKLITNRYISA